MTEKEKIILRHVELAKEYTRLSNSDHSLSPEVWENISKRMEKIQQEIEELRAIEHTWEEYHEQTQKEKRSSKYQNFHQSKKTFTSIRKKKENK